jgi:hypothetical protein
MSLVSKNQLLNWEGWVSLKEEKERLVESISGEMWKWHGARSAGSPRFSGRDRVVVVVIR